MANNTSQHILGTSSNLLGFCLFIITSLHISNKSESSMIDEYTSIIALLLTFSSILSFVSIKTTNDKIEMKIEKIANYFFLTALIGILGIIFFVLIKFWYL
ncbi:hypothetical protein [Flavobacterium sp.]|uniref:hypothetical protein n=1 Tax=Flavobacterium sp. TaxID=239 RepID=UPI0038FC3719